jgi:hypothetical protein
VTIERSLTQISVNEFIGFLMLFRVWDSYRSEAKEQKIWPKKWEE